MFKLVIWVCLATVRPCVGSGEELAKLETRPVYENCAAAHDAGSLLLAAYKPPRHEHLRYWYKCIGPLEEAARR